MNEQRRQILEMLAEGKVSADEAERLMNAVEQDEPEPSAGTASRRKSRPKYVRVIVEDDGQYSDGPTRINVRVPLRLLRAGVRLATLIPPQTIPRINAEIAKSGVPIDLNELKPEQLEELVDALDELTVNIDDPGSKVQVFCE